MRILFLFLAFTIAGKAAIQNVTVTEFTATQAILKYEAPDNSPCQVEVSEQPSFAPLVDDVDPAKFASAASDQRPGSVQAGDERFFVIGKRAAEVAQDGTRYSRALQADTQHYYRVTCPGPGNVATGTFKTMNIPFGNTYAEAEPADRARPGALAHPHLSLDNRTQRVVDPQTGMLIKRLSAASDTFQPVNGVPFTIARSTAWRSLSNLGGQDGQYATVSASTAPLFLAVRTNMAGQAPYTDYINAFAAAYTGRPHGAWGYYQGHVIASVNTGGRAPADPEDAKIVACLTIDGVNCYADADRYEAVLAANPADISFGTKVTGDLWQKSGGSSPHWMVEGTRTGSSMCDGTTKVRMVTGDFYGTHWVTGSAIQINGVDYTVASVTHTTEINLTSNCPSTYAGTGAFDADNRIFRTATDQFTGANNNQIIFVRGAGVGGTDYTSVIDQVVDARTVVTRDFPPTRGQQTTYGYPVGHNASNFGVLIRKKTASSDTVAIDYGYVNYEIDLYGSFTVGGVKLCSDFTVPGPTGKPGYNCQLPSGNFYWVDTESGEAHLWGNSNTEPNRGCGSDQQLFSPTNPDQYWCALYGPLYSTTYYGNHSEPVRLNPNGKIGLFQSLNNCNTSPPNAPPYTSQQPCLVTELITPGTDVPSLVQAFTANPAYAPQFDRSKFTYGKFKDIDENGNLILAYTRGSGFVVGWVVVFNPNATSNVEGGSISGPTGNFGCVGNGRPGCIVAAAPGWARPGCRWCTYKEGSTPFPGWVNSYTYGWTNSSPGSGPYYVQVIDGRANGTGNVLDSGASLENCPATSFNSTGRRCTRLTIASEPLSPAHGAGETGQPGELGDARVGDRFSVVYVIPTSSPEQALLIKKDPGAAPGTWVYTLMRDVNHQTTSPYYANTGPNPALFTVCTAFQDPSEKFGTYAWLWNFVDDPHAMNASGTTIPPDHTNINDHQFWSHGNFVVQENPSIEERCYGLPCYGTRVWRGQPFVDVITQPKLTALVSSSPKWGKGGGVSDESNMQSHVTAGGAAASPDRFPYFFDGRPYRGGYSSGSGAGTGSNPATSLGGQLFKFTAGAMPNIELPFRKIYPTAAFTGQLPLVDISSPAQGDVIGTGPTDSYKYCVAAVAGECRANSVAGDTYVNAPNVKFPFCYQADQAANLSEEYDICIGGSPAVRDAIVQVGMNDTDPDGRTTRVLTKMTRPRVLSVFHTPNVLPDGKWMIFESQFSGDASANKAILLGKVPPPSGQDKIDRTTFIPITLRIPAHAGSTAVVRFGYSENGDPGNYFCTSRAENCVSVRTSDQIADPRNPFYFEQTERATYAPVPCDTGCQISVPGIPQRVMYYQVVYTDANGGVTQTPMLATVVP